jgi:NADH-ubiquinone oxidoreductase chain 4L
MFALWRQFFTFIFIFICVALITVYFLLFISCFFSVCEGSLGLSILVSMIRSHGNDYFQSYSVLQR